MSDHCILEGMCGLLDSFIFKGKKLLTLREIKEKNILKKWRVHRRDFTFEDLFLDSRKVKIGINRGQWGVNVFFTFLSNIKP